MPPPAPTASPRAGGRSRFAARGLALLTASGLLAQLLVATPASATTPSWSERVAAVPSVVNQGEAVTHLERAVAAYPSGTGDRLGDTRVAAVATAAGRNFIDGNRFASADAGRATYSDERQLVSWLTARLQDGAAESENTEALTATLTAARMTAARAVADLEATVQPAGIGTPAAARDLQTAKAALALTDDKLAESDTVAAVAQASHAWERAYGALAALDVSYDGDADSDGLVDAAELSAGSSPLVADSDRDGLSDRFEVERLLGITSPAAADSDGNGIEDGLEDADGDGLDAAAEQRLGTSPTETDSDRDRIPDSAEAGTGTDPVNADTDGDTLLDGAEPPVGLSPTSPDTDGDAVRDDRDVVRAPAAAPDGLGVVLVGTGNVLDGFAVHRIPDGEVGGAGAAGRVGAAYDFTLGERARAGFAQAELSFPYDPAALGTSRPEDLRVMYLDPVERVWRLAAQEQAVDTRSSQVRVTVTHFSTYAVFDIRNWGATWTASTTPCRGRGAGSGSDVVLLDLSLVLDSSGSMRTNDPSGLRLTAAKNFVDALLPEDRAAVVDFDSSATVLQPLTSDKTAVKTAIDRIDANGGTNLAAGLAEANRLLVGNGDPGRARMVILLTDGVNDPWWLRAWLDAQTLQAAQTAAGNAITIYTIGLGTNLDEPLLQRVAATTGGTYHHVATAEELPQAFRRISEESGTGADTTTDTDGDGLTDCRETAGVRGPDGRLWTSDPTLPDTDSDGLTDAEELGDPVDFGQLAERYGDPALAAQDEAGAVAYQVWSDPRRADSDSDGLDDVGEGDIGTDPFRSDSDGDGLTDGVEADDLMTDPLSRNTDGDEWDDAYEVAEASRGLDPVIPDTSMSRLSYAVSFAKGATCGTWCFDDNIAWLSGNLIAGFLGYGDLVDLAKSVISAQWVSAGLNILALIPVVGDAGKVVAKVTKFVERVPRRFTDVTRLVATWDRLPDRVKTLALRALLPVRYGRLTDVGLTDDAIRRLARGERTDLRILADAARAHDGTVRRGVALPWRSSGTAGENTFRRATGLAIPERTVLSRKPYRWREHDATEVLPNGRVRNHEVKTGRTDRASDLDQCERDGRILRDPEAYGVDEIVWHFVPNGKYNSLGPNRALLDCLEREGIPLLVHPPAA